MHSRLLIVYLALKLEVIFQRRKTSFYHISKQRDESEQGVRECDLDCLVHLFKGN